MNDNTESRYAKWQSIIAEQENSGLSQKEFCDKHHLGLAHFAYYRGRIKSMKKAVPASSTLFSPIQLQKNIPTHPQEMRITLPNGFQCSFPCDVDAIHIKKCMEALLSC